MISAEASAAFYYWKELHEIVTNQDSVARNLIVYLLYTISVTSTKLPIRGADDLHLFPIGGNQEKQSGIQ